MKNIKQKILLLTFFGCFIAFNWSCKKLVTVDAPEGKIISDDLFKSDSTANAAVNGIYASLAAGLNVTDGYLTLMGGLAADELTYTGTNIAAQEFQTNSISTANTTNGALWIKGYAFIYLANACVEGMNASTTLTPSFKAQLIGECKVVRALQYFYLINLYDKVPLITSTNYLENANKERVSADEIYNYMVSDLLDAINLLNPSYPTSGRVRVNKYTAEALLARIYLFQGQWQKASDMATAIIASGLYSLPSDLNAVFLSNSSESIWQLRPTLSYMATPEGNTIIPSSISTMPNYLIRDVLLNSFETGDARKSKWVKSNTISAVNYYYPAKYQVRTATTVTEQYTIFRLSEQYLIRAEALTKLGTNLSGAVADLNKIRNRANLPNYAGVIDQPSILNAIIHERQVEFFAEGGHRWFDLKRYGIADAVLGAVKGNNWQTTDKLFPVPFSEIQSNYRLTQNPGYN